MLLLHRTHCTSSQLEKWNPDINKLIQGELTAHMPDARLNQKVGIQNYQIILNRNVDNHNDTI